MAAGGRTAAASGARSGRRRRSRARLGGVWAAACLASDVAASMVMELHPLQNFQSGEPLSVNLEFGGSRAEARQSRWTGTAGRRVEWGDGGRSGVARSQRDSRSLVATSTISSRPAHPLALAATTIVLYKRQPYPSPVRAPRLQPKSIVFNPTQTKQPS